jgi:YidC/Oxa1 family membrane protein insertase
VLSSAIELRQAPFMVWVKDLSAPDTLIAFGALPFFPDALHVLPLLMAASTVLMQRRAITDPRQQSLMYLMPFMMLFFFYNLPSGLNLYWTSQNLLAWAEQSITKGKITPATAKAA